LAARPTSDPEALGSPAGYAVPPGHRLLWPHPRHWTSPFDFRDSSPGLCVAAPRPSGSPLSSACPSVRAASHTPAERAGYGCWPPVRASLRLLCRGSASALGVSRLQSSLYAAARIVARPPFEDFSVRAFGPRVASMGRRTPLDGPTANSRRRTFTGWTRNPVGCTQSTHPT
jgi:hypothetical protein